MENLAGSIPSVVEGLVVLITISTRFPCYARDRRRVGTFPWGPDIKGRLAILPKDGTPSSLYELTVWGRSMEIVRELHSLIMSGQVVPTVDCGEEPAGDDGPVEGGGPGEDLVEYSAGTPRAVGSEDRLGELLLRERMISLEQLKQAQEEQKRSGTNLGYTLARMGYMSDEDISRFLATQYNVPAVNLTDYEIDPEIIALIPKEVALRYKVIPVQRDGDAAGRRNGLVTRALTALSRPLLIVAMADPTNLHAIDDIKFLTAHNVEPVVASEAAIMAAIDRYYPEKQPPAT